MRLSSSPGVLAEEKARMWARGWRKRWETRRGRPHIQDRRPLAEMQNKASLLESGWVHFGVSGAGKWDPFCAQIPGTKMGPP